MTRSADRFIPPADPGLSRADPGLPRAGGMCIVIFKEPLSEDTAQTIRAALKEAYESGYRCGLRDGREKP